MDRQLIEQFAHIVGKEHALTDADMIAPYLIENRGLFHGKTPLILRPETVDQVSQIMKLAYESKTPVVPQGGNTGLVGAQQPDQSGTAIILSLARLSRIRQIDIEGNLVVAEAGVVLQNLQKYVADAGRFFPLSLGSEGSCQLGGNLSSNAGGTAVLVYGNARDLCLGLEVVLPDGRILNDMRYVRKDNSGYDLKDLFIGAEGTLGVITAAVMKLFPKPKGRAVAFVGLRSPEKALQLLTFIQGQAGSLLTGFEIMAKAGMEMTLKHTSGVQNPLGVMHEWYALIDLSSPDSMEKARAMIESLLETAWNNSMIEDAAIAETIAQQNMFWRIREEMSPAQRPEGGSIKHDISVPVASIPDFIAEAGQVVEAMIPGARVVCFGHMGDGNLHYNVSQPLGADKAAFLKLWGELNHRIHSLVVRYQGAFSAEHGIGQLKREELLAFKSPVAIELMRGIKELIDPRHIMNPGKIL